MNRDVMNLNVTKWALHLSCSTELEKDRVNSMLYAILQRKFLVQHSYFSTEFAFLEKIENLCKEAVTILT
jgi:hypothetical protein